MVAMKQLRYQVTTNGLVGINTFIADNPDHACQIANRYESFLRIIKDSKVSCPEKINEMLDNSVVNLDDFEIRKIKLV